jgi:hypothetical protein
MKAQIMVGEETLAIAQDAKVSHLQIRSNLQKTHQDCCIHDPFRKDIFTVWLEISASNDDDATMRDLLELLETACAVDSHC